MHNSFASATLIQDLEKICSTHSKIADAYSEIEMLLLTAFRCERIAIFQRRTHYKDLVARFKTGTETREIKVTINTKSIAGYVAMAQHAIKVDNVNDAEELKAIHYKLRFDPKYDRAGHFKTQNILCVPIKNDGVLMGVLELLNTDASGFTDADAALANQITQILAIAYKYELAGTSRPFSYLVHSHSIDENVLKNFTTRSTIRQGVLYLETEHSIALTTISEALAIHYQVPTIDYAPDDYRITSSNVRLSISYLKRNNVVVLRDKKQRLIVLMFEPNNIALLMEIESALGTDDYQLAFALPDVIMQYLGEKKVIAGNSQFADIINEIDILSAEHDQHEESDVEDESAIVRLVSNCLSEAKRLNASDIHIDPEPDGPTLIRMRVDGVVSDINQIPENYHKAVVSRIKIMAGLNISERRIPQDGKLIFKLSGQSVEVRVATIPTVVGEGVVMRILAGGNAIPIDKLNLSERNIDMLEPMLGMPHGVFLVVGPTGSGKTSTLHAILGKLNTPDKKIWTAEDPVEITQYRLQQVQIDPKVGFTYAKALRAFLRADPDIILIGEMRDKETAHAGVEASLTGHLVFSTLHTNSASETVTRLLDLGIDPVSFSDACVGILAQRLVRTICKNCKQSYTAEPAEIAFIKRQYGEQHIDELGSLENLQLHRGKGCEDCNKTGYKGRTGVHELLSMSVELRGMIYNGCSNKGIKEQAMKDGMRTLVQDALIKVLKGETDLAQIKTLGGDIALRNQ